MPKATVCLLVSIVVLFSVSAFAVDGVVLINQASVMAAGGFPYVIAQSGSYRLSGNLTVPSGVDGIDINADNVTLDLNGFSITGPATCTGIPVTSCTAAGGNGVAISANDVTVKNGVVSGMSNAVAASRQTVEGIVIEDLHLNQNASDAILIESGIVRRNHIRSNGGSGLMMSGGVAEGNVIEFNRLDGVIVGNSFNGANGLTVIGNSILRNGFFGMIAQNTVYGSNIFNLNGLGAVSISPGLGVTSQNNNNCNGASC